jgi:nucleotide-binding universal stress UspA family protein
MTAQQTKPAPGTKEKKGPYRVIAACDFSPLGDRAVEEALRLCATHPAAAVHVLVVAAEGPAGMVLPGAEVHFLAHQAAQEAARDHVGKIIDEFVARGPKLPFEHVAVCVTVGSPSERIVALATALDADLIVLGTHSRRGLGRMLLGSVAEEVVRRAPCGVLVIRPRDFLEGEKLPEIQPPLKPGEHALLQVRGAPTYHYEHRLSRESGRIMPSI